MTGKIHKANALFLREAVGETTDDKGNKYICTTAVGCSSPIIQSGKTGKFFTLNWEDIVRLAVEAGIDK